MIKSPLNYTGNKSRILNQILPLFPENINCFVDLCCGGCSVGINVNANKVICIDNNKRVIELLKTLQYYSYDMIIQKLENIMNNFGLSNSYMLGYDSYREYIQGNNGLKNYNKDGFYELREYYNKNNFKNYRQKSLYLYALVVYGFNNDMRFNRSGSYNLPIGKTDFNGSIRKKIFSFKDGLKDKNIKFHCADMFMIQNMDLKHEDFVYIDPPYLITNAVYNESNGWSNRLEKNLLSYLDILNKNNVKFALSNILYKDGRENTILIDWIEKNNFIVTNINYHYRSSSYNKKNRNANEKEVVVTNYAI